MANRTYQTQTIKDRHDLFINTTITELSSKGVDRKNFISNLEEDFLSVFTRLQLQLEHSGKFWPGELKDGNFIEHEAMFWLVARVFDWAVSKEEGVYIFRKISRKISEMNDFTFEGPYIKSLKF